MRTMTTILVLVLLGGCFQELFDAGAALAPDSESSSSSSSSTGEAPTPTTGPGIQTVTGPPDETTGMSTSATTDPGSTGIPEQNAPPTIEGFAANPSHLGEAGKSEIQLTASDDVVVARLFLDGVLLPDVTLADFPYTYEALSAKDNLEHVFRVEVEDAEGAMAFAETSLTVQLPSAGAEKCIFTDKTAGASSISALAYTETAIVAVGTRNFKATVWLLDPDACEVVLPGWPKTIANWATDPTLAALPSRASAVAVDGKGNIAIGMNLTMDGKSFRYVVLVNSKGARLWEKPGGKPGETVSGIAAVPGGVVAVGWSEAFDAMIWRHMPMNDNTVSLWPTTLKAPFTPDEAPDDTNLRGEWARGVLYHPELDLLFVVGDREFMPDVNNTYRRTFVAPFVPLGIQVGAPWTSSGDSLAHDGANALALCGKDLVLGGWTRDEPPGSLPQPLTRWFSLDGGSTQRVSEPSPSTETFGIGCDREGKVVSAATRSAQPDAQVFAFEDPLGSRIWYEKGDVGNDAANALACDGRGFCAWGGFRTWGGKTVAVVRVHHP